MKNTLKILIILVIVEIIIRITWQIPGRSYPQGMHIYNEKTGYSLKPNFIGLFPGGNIPVSINSKGLRDYEHDYNKTEKTRILILGDTIAFGPGINNGETFTKLLEKKFLENNFSIEILNSAVNGYELTNEHAYYFEEGYKYNPDIVLLAIALNDIFPANLTEIKLNFGKYNDSSSTPPDTKIEIIVKKVCHACVFLYSISRSLIKGEGIGDEGYNEYVIKTWDNEEYLRLYKEELISLSTAIKKEKRIFVVAVFPYTWQLKTSSEKRFLPQQRLKELSNQENIAFIDLTKYFNKKDYKDFYAPLSGGRVINTEGHKLTSEALYQEFMERKIIKNEL